jgi:uncharacterized protein YecE (DUF72 family)
MTSELRLSRGVLRIGCAGWAIASASAPSFASGGSHLERYARVFGMVEINSSFYRPHRPATYARWAGSVPPGFRFAVKLPRAITHEAGLVGIGEPLGRFASEAGALGDKLGCLLVQLPPTCRFDAAVAGDFFARVTERFACMVACEARHPSWFGAEAGIVLERAGITRVIADPATGQPGPHLPTTQAIYVRLHGSPRRYYSSYPPAYLAQLARDMAIHAQCGRDVWVVFDNTAAGAALPNALQLRAALER